MKKRLVRAAQGGNRAVYGDSPESAAFKIKDCKLHVPVVNLSAEDDNNGINIDQKYLIRLKRTI